MEAGYGKLPVVSDVTLTLPRKGIVSLIGPNGSGKSTVIKAIFGVARIFSGQVIFDGIDITDMPAHKIVRLGAGYVPQVSNVFPNLTVEENLQIGTYVSDQIPERYMERIFSIFPELEDKLNQHAKYLSGGQMQMLAVGRTLVSQPKILALDEPTGGLAPKTANYLINRLKEVREMGIPILIVEQNVSVALEISDIAYILREGRVVCEDKSSILQNQDISTLFFGTQPK